MMENEDLILSRLREHPPTPPNPALFSIKEPEED
jgi:hypothetical protein